MGSFGAYQAGLREQLEINLPKRIAKAVADERERCAKIAEYWAEHHVKQWDGESVGLTIAAGIREKTVSL